MTSIESDGGAPGTKYRWAVLGLMFVLYTFAFADRANIGIALPHIKAEFGLSNAEAGLIASLFSMAYAVCQVPAAMLVRRFGINRIVPIFMTLTSIAAAAGGFAASALALKISRVVLGVVEAPLAISMTTTLNNWFAPKEKGTAAGIFIASTKFAPVVVPPIGAFIILQLSWHWVFFFFAVPGVLMAILWAFFVPDRPEDSRFVSAAEARHINGISSGPLVAERADPRNEGRFKRLDWFIRARHAPLLETPRQVFMSWTIWGAAIGYCLVQGIVGVILFLLPLYLTEVKQFSIMNVGFVAAAPFAGAVAGNLLGGWLSDRYLGSRRKPLMLLTFAATIFSMWLMREAPSNAPLLALMLFATGVLLAVGYSAYTVYPGPMTSKSAFPVALSVINTMGQIGTAGAPLIVGLSLDAYGWDTVFAGLSICSLIGFLALATIYEPLGALDGRAASEGGSAAAR
jgi:sugar phosphate permease